MFRARANPARLLVSKSKPLTRSYSNNYYYPIPPRVRLLGATLWSLTACTTIYLGCAAYEVYQDAQHAKAKGSGLARSKALQTFEELEHFRKNEAVDTTSYRFSRSASERPEFSDVQKLTSSIMGLTAGIHLASSIVPGMMDHLVHEPRLPRNYTLLTSVFGHAGLMHLGANLYGMFYFMPAAADSPTFKGSNAHLAAFYLSAGILSSLAHTRQRYGHDAEPIGILFLPGSLPISEAMTYVALFDAIGILFRYPYISLGHGAHLGGLACGVAGEYVHYIYS
ncbi:hypothetical protein EKO27_g7121 [Xylaria grammica]|uniref:Peptidase S54 rhomboid domain-containing protein n=1 Tax=Xylaria grammica TaxID=363999 RepID=A0A439D0J4_9PEZI|nr:hypothetical protein EKO27_g7121 [Xylaria grammica]